MTIKKIAFVAYPSKKTDEARKFWGDLLGLEHKFDHGGEGGCWSEFDAPDGKTIAIDGFAPDDSQVYLALETDDIEAEVARLKAAGVPIQKDVWDNQVCKMALISDPEAQVVMLHQVAPDRVS